MGAVERKAAGSGAGPPRNFQFPQHLDYYSYGDFHTGLARFWIGDAMGIGGYIDATGEVIIGPRFTRIGDFSEGLAYIAIEKRGCLDGQDIVAGFINRGGDYTIETTRDFLAAGFSEGRCVIKDLQLSEVSLINEEGRELIPPGIYTAISHFQCGIAKVIQDKKEGYIDSEGGIVIAPIFDRLAEFEMNHLTTGAIDGRTVIVDRGGRCVRELAFGDGVELGPLRCGLARINSMKGVGYMNAEGKIVIPMEFDSGFDFRDGLALVTVKDKMGYINTDGDVVWMSRWQKGRFY